MRLTTESRAAWLRLPLAEDCMPIAAVDLEAALRAAFPEGEVVITDLAGDGDHYRARVTSSRFAGLSRVKQHQLVYAALEGRVGGEIHALALETVVAPTAI